MAGLVDLNHTCCLSDEALVGRGVENPYWQAFYDGEYFQQEPPIHPTNLKNFRNRLGPARGEELLHLTRAKWIAQRVIQERELAEVLVTSSLGGKNERLDHRYLPPGSAGRFGKVQGVPMVGA
jgi:IS5 family transposase